MSATTVTKPKIRTTYLVTRDGVACIVTRRDHPAGPGHVVKSNDPHDFREWANKRDASAAIGRTQRNAEEYRRSLLHDWKALDPVTENTVWNVMTVARYKKSSQWKSA